LKEKSFSKHELGFLFLPKVAGLIPGSIYSMQVRAVGGSTGYSDWSDPVSHMVM
jgi:hypothetical protein